MRCLINTARSLIFSTAPPPPAIAGALAALELLQERPHRVAAAARERPRPAPRARRARAFRSPSATCTIVPLIVGDERDAMRLCQEAIARGVFAQAISPPTVPAGTSRLRLTAMASHTPSDLHKAARVLGAVARDLGLDPATMSPPPPERIVTEVESYPPAGAGAYAPSAEPARAARAPFDFERAA